MAEPRVLVVRLGSLGDVVHALPAVAALRETFPAARIDWLVERKWAPLVQACPDVDRVMELERGSWRALAGCVARLREARYTCAIDFQGLYKSAILAWLSGASRCVGFERQFAREGGAAMYYSMRVAPMARHVVDQNLALAKAAGARRCAVRFPLCVPPNAEAAIERFRGANNLREYSVVSPGGGWRSKCWPAERYGGLCAALHSRLGWRSVVNYGPGEEALAEGVSRAAEAAVPVLFSSDLPELMALLRSARFVVAADSGPLHLAVALGTPAVALFGPTDPARNGPYSAADIVVRNASADKTTYKRGDEFSPAMLSISVAQVVAAVERRMGIA